jgi:hypothetical protein
VSARIAEDVDLLDIEERVDEARHAAALCRLAVAGVLLLRSFDKDALAGLEALLASHQDSLASIGGDIRKARTDGGRLKLVSHK